MVIMSLYSLEGDFPDRNGIHILLVMTNCIFTAHSPGKRNENSVPHSAAGQHETSQADSCWYDLQQDHPWSQNLYPYTCQTEMSCHYGSFLRYQMLPGLHLIEGEHSLPCIETNTVYSHTHQCSMGFCAKWGIYQIFTGIYIWHVYIICDSVT